MALAETQYARSGDADIAYQVIGDGPRDVMVIFDWGSHLEEVAAQPLISEFIGAIARFSRLLWFDMRGIGMSGRVAEGISPIESWMGDLLAVMDAAGSERATLLAQGQAAQMAVMAAATHRERVTSLVLVNGFARFARADDYPAGMPERIQSLYLDLVESQWGKGTLASVLGPSVADRPGVVEWWARVERYGATPGMARVRAESTLELDVRELLSLIDVPTLVVHNRDNEFVRVGHGRYLAKHIRSATLVERESPDHWTLPEPDLLATIEEFVTGERPEVQDTDRVLATVLFMDVVSSTERVSELGDEGWRRALDLFEQTVHDGLERYTGELSEHGGRRDPGDIRRPRPRNPLCLGRSRPADAERAGGSHRPSCRRGDEAGSRCRGHRRAHRCTGLGARRARRGARHAHRARSRRRIWDLVRRTWRAQAERRSRPLGSVRRRELAARR